MKKHIEGFTLVELLVLVIVMALLAVFVIAIQTPPRINTRRAQSKAQLRGIHQSLVMYAQNNRGQYPGLNAKRELESPTVEARFKLLIAGGFFTADYAICPIEVKTIWTSGKVTTDNYSYAMLDITEDGVRAKRAVEWQEHLNDKAAVIGDRNLGVNSLDQVRSLYGDEEDAGQWRGSVVYNDNHVVFEKSHVISTQYGEAYKNAMDNLFSEDTENSDEYCDAMFIYSGE
ncbi:hypothetical protein JD969_04670 [Planctomycetota bacterium]|nr:hypothetical protein JD969_04670 [Planctomycetota bacterium]